jgi:hypothetical protein
MADKLRRRVKTIGCELISAAQKASGQWRLM